jgi:hypothetical protein
MPEEEGIRGLKGARYTDLGTNRIFKVIPGIWMKLSGADLADWRIEANRQLILVMQESWSRNSNSYGIKSRTIA